MGLKLSRKDFHNGVILNDVYCKIDSVSGNKERISYTVNYYANIEARMNELNSLSGKTRSFIPDNTDNAENIFIQCYQDLKANDDEFKDAIDVLEDY